MPAPDLGITKGRQRVSAPIQTAVQATQSVRQLERWLRRVVHAVTLDAMEIGPTG